MRLPLLFGGSLLLLSACGSEWRYRDLDGDGYTPAEGDCWDKMEGPEGSGISGQDIGPHAQETWYDGVDQDCAGDDDYDADGDGWVPEEAHLGLATAGVPNSGNHSGSGDCWDAPLDTVIPSDFVGVDGTILTPAEVNPASEDTWYDGIDQDCAADDDFDQDSDGFASADHENREGETGDDCADTDESIHPEAEEICDELDNDCDGLTDIEDDSVNLEDLPTWYVDADEDGFGDPNSGQVTCERPDGHVEEALATDCDDDDALINPDGDEICDEIDNDCDGLVDDEDSGLVSDTGEIFYADNDGDGFGDPDNTSMACLEPSGYTTDATDCDDADEQIHPGADELCATVGIDDDCDGSADEDDAVDTDVFYLDGDGDGFGDPSRTTDACDAPSGYVFDPDDCDDGDADINPDATEICDRIDNDCDGDIDDDDSGLDTSTASTWYMDADADGYGDASDSTLACDDPGDEYVSDSSDCDDDDDEISPDAAEICDSVDNDCDGDIDDADSDLDTDTAETWYADSDGDGFGNPDRSTAACLEPSGYLDDDGDCDDGDSTINPDATEVCDEVDNDCDDDIDDEDSDLDTSTGSTWYTDSDGDGYGDASRSEDACEAPSGSVDNDEDCDDGDSDISPDGTEVCDEIDNDCDGDIDDEDSSLDSSTTDTFYADSDGDGYGSETGPTLEACEAPTGYLDDFSDCDDGDSAINPDEDEICNDGLDNDCDGTLGETADGDTCELSDLGLADANVVFSGSSSQDVAGLQLAMLPDLDGDGVADLAIAAPYEDSGASNAGAVYIYTGLDSLDAGDQENWDLESTSNLVLTGENSADHAGLGLAAGDLDGDGFADLLVTAPHNDDEDTGAGIGYLFYGPVTDTGTLSLGDADDSYTGYAAGDYVGWSASMGGDTDGDGCTDILVGAPQDPVANASSGSTSGPGYAFLLPAAEISSGCTGASVYTYYYGEDDGDAAGYSVDFVDYNGDGDSEVLIGAPLADSEAGVVYVAEGDESGFLVPLGPDMVTYTGESSSDRAGWSVANAGDVNDDGYEDIIVGAYANDDGGNNSGSAYLILGPRSITDSEVDLDDADAQMTGSSNGDGAGYDVASAGDLDGDGYGDLLIGAWKDDDGGNNSGTTFVVLGPVTGSLSLSSADALFEGDSRGDLSGAVLSGGRDVNDDGYDDILVGAYYADDGGTSSGAAYLILGLGQ